MLALARVLRVEPKAPKPSPGLSLVQLRDLARARGRELILAREGFEIDGRTCKTLAEVRHLLHEE